MTRKNQQARRGIRLSGPTDVDKHFPCNRSYPASQLAIKNKASHRSTHVNNFSILVEFLKHQKRLELPF
jgi:hypothetical protein